LIKPRGLFAKEPRVDRYGVGLTLVGLDLIRWIDPIALDVSRWLGSACTGAGGGKERRCSASRCGGAGGVAKLGQNGRPRLVGTGETP